MASIDILYKITVSIIFLMVLVPQTTEATSSSLSNFLSLLSEKLHVNKPPVILVLDDNRLALPKAKPTPSTPVAIDTSDEDHIIHLAKHLLAQDEAKGKLQIPFKKSTATLPKEPKQRQQKYRAQRARDEGELQREDKAALRSPIVKKLLRISQSLRCEAKDECQDKCSNKFHDKKAKKCIIQCEIKYECDEEPEYVDPCLENDCRDSCGGSNECNPKSTRGVKLVNEEPGCAGC